RPGHAAGGPAGGRPARRRRGGRGGGARAPHPRRWRMRLDPERFLVNVGGCTPATSPKARPPRLATIDCGYDPGTFPGVWPRVVFDGETTPTRKRWPVLSG